MAYALGGTDRRLAPFVYERQISTGQALGAFFADLELTGSPATLSTYRSLLRELPVEAPADTLTPRFCRELISDRFRRQKPATARTYRAALSAFCAWLVDHGHLTENPVSSIPRPRGPSAEPKVLSRPQLRALWEAAHDDTDRLILLLLGVGLRRAEAVKLRVEDVGKDGSARIAGKGRKVRQVWLNEAAMRLLPKTGRVLDMNASALFQRLKRMGKEAGIPWVHPHALRHSYATWWMMDTQDMETLRTLGGWSDHSVQPRHYARRALAEAALSKARRVNLDLYED